MLSEEILLHRHLNLTVSCIRCSPSVELFPLSQRKTKFHFIGRLVGDGEKLFGRLDDLVPALVLVRDLDRPGIRTEFALIFPNFILLRKFGREFLSAPFLPFPFCPFCPFPFMFIGHSLRMFVPFGPR
jgi:hypothetical protein